MLLNGYLAWVGDFPRHDLLPKRCGFGFTFLDELQMALFDQRNKLLFTRET